MKVKKMVLDESILDNFDSQPLFGDRWVEAPELGPGLEALHSSGLIDTYDDDFIDLEGIPSTEIDTDHLERPTPGPQTGAETGVASMLIDAINDEWATIDKYNSIIATLRSTPEISNPEAFITVMEEINAEENRHVGQLQTLLKQISPNTTEIQKGQQEARAQMSRFVGGKLPVQAWETPDQQSLNPSNEISEVCSLSDIDDEM